MTEFSFWYDDHTVVTGLVEIVNHETLWPSRPAEPELRIHQMQILVYIGRTDYDLTAGFEPKHQNYFRAWFREKVREKHWGDLISGNCEEGA